MGGQGWVRIQNQILTIGFGERGHEFTFYGKEVSTIDMGAIGGMRREHPCWWGWCSGSKDSRKAVCVEGVGIQDFMKMGTTEGCDTPTTLERTLLVAALRMHVGDDGKSRDVRPVSR